MPQVGNKHYSYTPKGKAKAARAKKKQSLAGAMEGAQKLDYQSRSRDAAMRGGYDAPTPYVGKTKKPNYGGSDR